MRKQIVHPDQQHESPEKHNWLDLEKLAQVEITSEEQAHPIEAALTATPNGTGWLAAAPGKQTIRLVFDEPQKINRIQLLFREQEQERTQEFQIRSLAAGDQSYREIVRQQYNFSPPHNTEEFEDYTVELDQVKALELIIYPDISGRGVYASLAQLRIS